MKFSISTPFNLLSLASLATAHTIFAQLESGGVTNPVSYGVRTPSYDGPITDVTSDSLACNGDPNPTMDTPYIIDVSAGSTVTAIWRHTLQSGSDDVMDASHLGPTLAYLKKVDSAVDDSGVGDGWFKIQEDGYSNGVWGTTKVIENGGNHAITIPDCIEDGEYLLRAEMIALHAAGSTQGAQLYMECAQIRITGGSGTVAPASTISFPGEYSATDPGLLINIYSMTTSSVYTIPGPEVFTCDAGTPPSSTTTNPTTTTLVTSTTTTSSESTSTTASEECAAMWGQCGGVSWTGPTCCQSGSTCTATNEYYSQCL